MLNNAQLAFERDAQALGLYTSTSSDWDDSNANVFIHFDDCRTKKMQSAVLALVRKHGLRYDVSDKGLHVFAMD